MVFLEEERVREGEKRGNKKERRESRINEMKGNYCLLKGHHQYQYQYTKININSATTTTQHHQLCTTPF